MHHGQLLSGALTILQGGERHHAEAAHLDHGQDHHLAEGLTALRRVDDDEAGDTRRGDRREQGHDQTGWLAGGSRDRQHQQHGAQRNPCGEAEHHNGRGWRQVT